MREPRAADVVADVVADVDGAAFGPLGARG
jgi:hypothetical protein